MMMMIMMGNMQISLAIHTSDKPIHLSKQEGDDDNDDGDDNDDDTDDFYVEGDDTVYAHAFTFNLRYSIRAICRLYCQDLEI